MPPRSAVAAPSTKLRGRSGGSFFSAPPSFFFFNPASPCSATPPPPLYPSFFCFVHLRVNASRPLRIQQVTQRGDHVTSLFLRDPPIMNQEYQGGPRAGGGRKSLFATFQKKNGPKKYECVKIGGTPLKKKMPLWFLLSVK